MCRGKSAGGRRCPGCEGSRARAAHNARRRDNRAIKRALVDGARRAGHPAPVLQDLERANPKAVKNWAEALGLNPAEFLSSYPPEVPPPAASAAPGVTVAPAPRGAALAMPHRGHRAPPALNAPVAGNAGRAAAGLPRHQTPAGPAVAQPAGWRAASWATAELSRQIYALEAQQGGHRDERNLLFGNVATLHRPSGAGTNETVRVELDNGVLGYHKPFDGLNSRIARSFGHTSAEQSVHEVVAWQVAREMGPPWSEIVPPCVVREVNGRMGSFALERAGKTGNRSFDLAPEWRDAAFFDALIGQQDRHYGNWLMAGDRLTLIDHGYAFAKPGNYCNWSMLLDQRVASAPTLTYQERAGLDRLLASPDLLGLEQTLPADRVVALRDRAGRMRSTGRVLNRGDY